MNQELSIQEKYALKSICFGCGPANDKGLHIRSFPKGDKVVATWHAEKYHQAFPGVLNGGIVGSLLDCHSNWTAAWHLMQKNKLAEPPCTVTSEYSIKLTRPTPVDKPIELEAWIVESQEDRATIEAKLIVAGKVCATCRGVFVAVKPGHPAYYRW
jgi:acyl-coenzyme A thioesterase PaaI-like protein